MDPRDSKDGAGRDPAPSGAPSSACVCEQPLPKEKAEYKGSARTICLRCGLQVSLRLGR